MRRTPDSANTTKTFINPDYAIINQSFRASFKRAMVFVQMAKRTGPTNENLRGLIISLNQVSRKLKIPLWKRIAEELSRPTRSRRSVNIQKIEKHSKDGETVIVPGKVLGTGDLTKKVKVAAFRFSDSAKLKIKSPMTIEQLLKENPKGKGVRIIG